MMKSIWISVMLNQSAEKVCKLNREKHNFSANKNINPIWEALLEPAPEPDRRI